MKKRLFLFSICFSSFLLFSQEVPEGSTPGIPASASSGGGESITAEPVESSGETIESSVPAAGQETAAEDSAEEKKSVLDPAYVLERDIETSTDAELADWCLSLGLDSSGGRDALAARLREHYTPKTPEAETSAPAAETPGEETAAPVISEAAGINEAAETTAVTETTPDEPGEGELTITIENARDTEYFTVESVEEEYVRLSGGVSITIRDGEILHKVKADQILYNRTRKLMSASGSVEYVKEEGDTVETFYGEGVTVNLDNWSTAFMRGVSDHGLAEGETRYRFAGEVISKSGEDSTVLRRAEITNAGDKESYWSIKASKLWLLPGSDFAAVNAVIKVGEVPVLWLPGFFYPGNEIIFHPVLGYRAREGTYLQTTTYILGRPKVSESSEESSITSIMGGGEGMERVREGIFLRSTGKKARDEGEPRLSFMADAYVHLGYFFGTELVIPPKENFGELLFSAGIGFSRDIAHDHGIYTPFFPDYDGTSRWHHSWLFGTDVPYRFRFVSTGSANTSGSVVERADVSWKLPFYSDPYVDNDFMRRSEDSSLFSLIKNLTTPDMTISETTLPSYTWQLNGSLSFVTTGLEPYVNDLSITSAAVAVAFDTRTAYPQSDSRFHYTPDKSFFYPGKFTLFSVGVSIGGIPVTIGEQTDETGEDASIPLWPNPLSPWERLHDPENRSPDETELRPPSLTREISAAAVGGHRFTLDYRVTPSVASELSFNSAEWERQEDIDWSDVEYQLYSVRADGNIGFTLSEQRDIYTHALRFYGSSSWQDYTYMNESIYGSDTSGGKSRREAAMRQVRNMTYFSNSAEYSFTLRPFYVSEVWRTSNFKYTLKGLLVSGKYEDDIWETRAGRWDRDDIELHNVQGNFNANIMDYMQSFSVTLDLPPEESALTADATARAWISETNAKTTIRKPFEDPYYEPLLLTETLRFADNISLRHYMAYDPEKSAWTTVTTSLVWKSLTAGFTASRSKSYELKDGVGWIISSDDEKLNPQELTVGYNRTHSIGEGSIISFNGTVDTGLSFDLQRYTYSRFYFTLGLGARINRFLDIKFSSHSENAVIYRYFQDLPVFGKVDLEAPGEKNPFIDLVNSFRFDDTRKREASGFKLKSFNLDLVHHLGDWDATLGINLYPEQDTTTRQYRFMSEISFMVQWKPIKEFKTDLKYKTDEGFNYE